MQRPTFRLATTFLSVLIYLAVSTFSAATQEKPSSNLPPANDGKWERYTGKGEAFTALFPEIPTASIAYRPARIIMAGEAERYRGTLYSAYSDGVVYLIYSFPHHSESIKQFAAEFENRHAHVQKVVFARDINVNGFTGQRYLIKFRDVDGVLDFYITNNRAYILHIVGGDENNLSVRRFLESFTIGTVDGTGKDLGFTAIEIKPDLKKPAQLDDSQDSGPFYTFRDVTRKAVIVFKPEPQYTEEARAGRVSGTVILKAVLSSSGKVTRIEVEKSLPRGLTEKCIEATRGIRFIPAIKDGQFVSQIIQAEYGFSVF